MNKYVARLFHLVSGELHLVVHEFERLEDAIECGIQAACHSFKVYDQDGCVCHDSGHHHPTGPYC
jgi:hypothetical protein